MQIQTEARTLNTKTGKLEKIESAGLDVGTVVSYANRATRRTRYVVVSEEMGTYGQRCIAEDASGEHEVSRNDIERPGGWRLEERAEPWSAEAVDELKEKRRQYVKAQKAEREKKEARRKKHEEKGRALIEEHMPKGTEALIIAELHEDQCDLHTDYFGSSVARTVVLAYSSHTRRLFSEMRKAARRFEPTAPLADMGDDVEHREDWSMGSGYFLQEGRKYSGWRVKKVRLSYGIRPIAEAVGKDPENNFLAPKKGEAKKTSGSRSGADPASIDLPDGVELYAEEYSAKSFVVRGDTREAKEQLKALRGRFNPRLKGGPGWIFSKRRTADVCEALGLTADWETPNA